MEGVILGLIQNTAVLLIFSMLYDYSWVQDDRSKNLPKKLFAGFIIGCIGIILMLTPWKQVNGIVFDTRSVLLSLSGLFFGLLPTVIAAFITGAFRAVMGGEGVWMGITVILTAGAIGVLWRKIRPGWIHNKKFIIELALLGYIVHITMLLCAFLLPPLHRMETMNNILIPLITIYPAGTILLGILMVRQYNNWKNSKASDKLEESERKFSEMLKNTLLFSIIIDRQGKIVFCNESLLKVTGYSFAEISGKNAFNTFIPNESLEKVKDDFLYILHGKTGYYNYETELLTNTNSRLNVSWNATILKYDDNTVSGLACIGENITLRKQAEAELINAKLKAEESDKLKTIFLANISHEIRTPMNAIIGFSELLNDNDITAPEKEQYIRIIRSSSDRLIQIINDIIDISKLETGQFKISLSSCDLINIIKNSVRSFTSDTLLTQKKDLKLIASIPGSETELLFLSDHNRIRQVVDNLISNAIKYTEKGVIEIGYTIKTLDNEKYIEVFVRDTGVGIPANMNDVIFERFRQVEEGRFHEGIGLGLSISKGILDLLGGKIWFTSELEKGTVFSFTVPYIPPEKSSVPDKETAEHIPDLRNRTVVIAEDDYNSYFYLRLLLEELNAEVIHAENGLSLLKTVQQRVPDIILLDLNMPVKSGLECLKEIRQMKIRSKIIVQTAYSRPDEKDQCIKEGCHGYLSKPIRKTDLYDTIYQALQ